MFRYLLPDLSIYSSTVRYDNENAFILTEEEYINIKNTKIIPYYFDGTQWRVRQVFDCCVKEVVLNVMEEYILELPDQYTKLLIDGIETSTNIILFKKPGTYTVRIEPFPYLPVFITFIVKPTLNMEIDKKTKDLKTDCNKYILLHYSYAEQNTFKTKFSQIIDELTNNYNNYTSEQITQLQTAKSRLLEVQKWIESILNYYYSKLDEIKNAADLATLDTIAWDFSQFDSTDPQVTIEEIRNILQGVLWA